MRTNESNRGKIGMGMENHERRGHVRNIRRLLISFVAIFAFFSCGCDKAQIQTYISKTQPPVQITLTSYAIFKGYYVNVMNTSSNTTIDGVVVTYTGLGGATKTQTIGTLKPNESKTLDPSEVDWTVVTHESISVSANGYLAKTLETGDLIDQTK